MRVRVCVTVKSHYSLSLFLLYYHHLLYTFILDSLSIIQCPVLIHILCTTLQYFNTSVTQYSTQHFLSSRLTENCTPSLQAEINSSKSTKINISQHLFHKQEPRFPTYSGFTLETSSTFQVSIKVLRLTSSPTEGY